MKPRWRSVGALVCWGLGGLVGSLPAPLARAESVPRIQLLYERGRGAESCADAHSFMGELVARLGLDPFVSPGESAEETVQVSLTGVAAELRSHLSLRDSGGRELGGRDLVSHSTNCEEMEKALVLEVAMALDPGGALPRAQPPAVEAPARSPLPPPSSSSRKPASWLASVGVAGSAGAAPGPALGFVLWVETRWRSASLGLEGRVDLPAQTMASEGTVQAALLFGQVVPCLRYKLFGGCALLAAGVEQGSAVGLTVSYGTITTAYVAVGARAFGELPLYGPLSVRLQGDLLAPLAKTQLKIGDQIAWSSPPVSGSLAALVLLRFL